MKHDRRIVSTTASCEPRRPSRPVLESRCSCKNFVPENQSPRGSSRNNNRSTAASVSTALISGAQFFLPAKCCSSICLRKFKSKNPPHCFCADDSPSPTYAASSFRNQLL